MITTIPAMIRVDTRNEIDLMPITSRASTSSLMRIAPSSAVAPAPTVAASAVPQTTGATTRTLASAAKNPVNASTPMLPSDENPWIAISEPPDNVTKPTIATVPPITAMAPVPIPISAISRTVSLRYRRSAQPISAIPTIENQTMRPQDSRTFPGAPAHVVARGYRARSTTEAVISMSRSEPHADGGQHDVYGEQREDAEDQGFVDGGANALGAALRCQPAVAADEARDQSERSGLDQRDDHLGQARDEGQRRYIGACRHMLQIDAEDVATDEADDDHRPVQKDGDERCRDHPGNDQPLDRIDSEDLHRVDLFPNGASPEVGANGRRSCAGDHQHRDQRPQLGDRAKCSARA